jgi:hypothetical protein
MRESHSGAAWVAALAYSGFGLMLLVWATALVVGYAAVSRKASAAFSIPLRTWSRSAAKAGTTIRSTP